MAFYRCDRGLGYDTSNSTGTQNDVLVSRKNLTDNCWFYGDKSIERQMGRVKNVYTKFINVGSFNSDIVSDTLILNSIYYSDYSISDTNLIPSNISYEVDIFGVRGSTHLVNPRISLRKKIPTSLLTKGGTFWGLSGHSRTNAVYANNSNYLTFFDKNTIFPQREIDLDTYHNSEFEKKLFRSCDMLRNHYYTLLSQMYDCKPIDYRTLLVPWEHMRDPEAYIRDKYSDTIDESFDYNNYLIKLYTPEIHALSGAIEVVTMLSETIGIFNIQYNTALDFDNISFYRADGECILTLRKDYNASINYTSANFIVKFDQNYDISSLVEFPADKYIIINYDNPYLWVLDKSGNLIIYYNIESCTTISTTPIDPNIHNNDFKIIDNSYILISNYTMNSRDSFVYKYTKTLEKVSEWAFHNGRNSHSDAPSINTNSISYTMEPTELSENTCRVETGYYTGFSSSSSSVDFYLNWKMMGPITHENIVTNNESSGTLVGRSTLNIENRVYGAGVSRNKYYLYYTKYSNFFEMVSTNNLRLAIDSNAIYIKIRDRYYACNNPSTSGTRFEYYTNYFDNMLYIWKNVAHSGYSEENDVTIYDIYLNILYLLNNYNEINITNIDSSNESYTDYYFN